MAYTSRVQTILDIAKAIFKDRSGGSFTEATIVIYANMLLPELESRGAFHTFDTFDMTEDDYDYDLNSEFSDLVKPVSLGFKGSDMTRYRPLTELQKMDEYLQAKAAETAIPPAWLKAQYGDPPYVFFREGYAYVWPAPTETVTDGFQLWYRNSATQIADEVNPPTPQAYDLMYAYWAAHMGFLGDRPSRTSPSISDKYELKALDMVNKYMRSIRSGHTVLRTDR